MFLNELRKRNRLKAFEVDILFAKLHFTQNLAYDIHSTADGCGVNRKHCSIETFSQLSHQHGVLMCAIFDGMLLHCINHKPLINSSNLS